MSATGGGEGTVHLWSLNPSDDDVDMDGATPKSQSTSNLKPLHTIEPPLDPDPSSRAIRSLAFHPSSEYLAIASEDTTFHLYSLHNPPTIPASSFTTSSLDPVNLATHDAHALAPHTLSFSPSGSLLCSAGADAHGRIWDIRTGRTIMLLSGHMREIHSSSWAPDGHRVVTGSADGLGIVWDLRVVRETAKLPLHQRGVTDVVWYQGDGSDGVIGAMEGKMPSQSQIDATFTKKEEPGDESMDMNEGLKPSKSGTYIVSCGFDKEVAFTSPDDGVPVKRLKGHNSHVLGADVSGDGRWVGSGGYDRTVKIWGTA